VSERQSAEGFVNITAREEPGALLFLEPRFVPVLEAIQHVVEFVCNENPGVAAAFTASPEEQLVALDETGLVRVDGVEAEAQQLLGPATCHRCKQGLPAQNFASRVVKKEFREFVNRIAVGRSRFAAMSDHAGLAELWPPDPDQIRFDLVGGNAIGENVAKCRYLKVDCSLAGPIHDGFDPPGPVLGNERDSDFIRRIPPEKFDDVREPVSFNRNKTVLSAFKS
jgi:hypothetical protein